MLRISADRLFDGSGTATLLHPVVTVGGERIEAVEKGLPPSSPTTHASPPLPKSGLEGVTTHHFPGCTILPGLIDTHVHMVFSAAETNEAIIAQVTGESDEQLWDRAMRNARAALHAGLTTIRDCGGRGRITQEVRDCIRRGDAEGPDVLACGAPLTTRTGHCHWLGLMADTPVEVRHASEKMLAEDADFLKVMATGGNMTPGSDPMRSQYPPQTLELIAHIGRSAGKQSAAHVLSRAAFPSVVAARFRTIEHCDWRVEEWRYEFDPELARRMIDQDQYAGLTMSATTRRAFLPQIASSQAGPILRLNDRFACERRLLDSGVRYTLHSDAGVRLTPINRFDLGLRTAVIELRLTPAEVLRAVTRTAAEALSLPDRGMVTPGRRADLLIVEGNPLEDLACLERVRAVMKAGRWVVGGE